MMSVALSKCEEPSVIKILARMLMKFHKPLCDRHVTVGVLWAKPKCLEEDDGGCVLMLQGYPAAAVVRITASCERALGSPDAVITIDFNTWESLGEDEQDALLDHELEHLELVVNEKTGEPRLDEHGRPKLRCKRHDWHLGGFHSVARRHGSVALEVEAVQRLTTSNLWRQMNLKFPTYDDLDSADAARDQIAAARL